MWKGHLPRVVYHQVYNVHWDKEADPIHCEILCRQVEHSKKGLVQRDTGTVLRACGTSPG